MKRLTLIFTIALILAGCGSFGGLSNQLQQVATPSPTAGQLRPVTIAMGYIPNVQFAPFFVANAKGYFAAVGIKPTFDWGLEVDGVKLIGTKQIEFANVSGDQIIQARAQGIPIEYVANWYNAFPIEVVSLKDKGIAKPQDLIGKKVGLPCLCGASYTAWRALLSTQEIDPAAINVQNIGFTQVTALLQGSVDAVVVYANNEPVQLKLAGKDLNEIKIWEYAQLVGNGIAVNEETVKNDPELVKRFIAAFLKGVRDTIANPEEALQLTIQVVPETGGKNLASSRAVLNASVALWQNTSIGKSRPDDWSAMEKFMRSADFIHSDVDVTAAYTNDLVP